MFENIEQRILTRSIAIETLISSETNRGREGEKERGRERERETERDREAVI